MNLRLVDVILPLPVDNLYTYCVPPEMYVQVGHRVIVQFGKKKYYTAIAAKVYEGEVNDPVKEIVSVLDKYPIVLPSQLEFWQWLSFYYMCKLGDVYKAALPSALKLESETFIQRNPLYENEIPLTPTEQRIFYSIPEKHSLKVSEIERELKLSNIIPHVKSLVDKDAVFINENMHNIYSAKKEIRIRLVKDFTEEELTAIFENLHRAKKQYQLLLAFLEMREKSADKSIFSLPRKELLEKTGSSSTILEGLMQKGILSSFQQEISRFNYGNTKRSTVKELNIYQQDAYREIKNSFMEKPVTLLHGVTSSGKTEIYIQLIKDIIAEGKQVLYLLPEIALTTQITERLKSVFGNQLLVYHSKFNDNERAETWNSLLLKDEIKIVLGARSAIFLPFKGLGLIIVDEEHESSYKQHDPAPRYNGKNAAIMLAQSCQAKVLLGTATPAIETYYNALSGRYGLVSLNKRHDNLEMPAVITVNIKELKRKKQMKYILSPDLISGIRETLLKGKQAILFQNRRGFAPLLECKVCAWTLRCEHCDVSLTYHKGQNVMSCHYCGAIVSPPEFCPNCEAETLSITGYGTERIEEETKEIFTDARVTRMDTDTTRSKKAYEHIIADLENKKTDILIGTQMVSKGLDFENVNIVGIVNADSLLNYPDFRSHEKAFQLMTQVSGRAGRKKEQGTVMLQTSQPEHPVISCVVNNDYKEFYYQQVHERKLFYYPPFCRLISIILKGKEEDIVEEAARLFAASLKGSFQQRVLGPTKPAVSRIKSLYIRHILLKIENEASPQKVREAIYYHQQTVAEKTELRSVKIYFDVDPLA